MRARLIAVRERRARLIARAQHEREQLGRIVGRADAALAWVERARDAVAELRRRPLLVAGVVLAVAALRPRRAIRLAASAVWLWRLWRSLRPFAAAFLEAARAGRGSAA